MTTQSGTTSPATSMMPLVKSSSVRPDWRCCGMGQEGSPVVKGRSACTRNMTMNIGMEEGSRRHGGIRDSAQKNETFSAICLPKKAFLKATPVLKNSL